MTTCCSKTTQGIDRFFSRSSRRYLKRFHRKGLGEEQKLLVEGITSAGVSDQTILEIGCGVGGLHLALLNSGARFATGIDIAQGMLECAQELTRELHLEKRTQHILGDFVNIHDVVQDADITILDKVICCYGDVDSLVRRSLAKTRATYAISFPNSNAVVRLLFKSLIAIGRLLNWAFHPYWHDWETIVASINAAGFRQSYRRTTLFWTICVFEKVDRHHP